ncbi:hypothetical protein BKA70DRAFT_215794 [Coprinopsis sp. MPI-PUGE-AT-0042]|nr:hypothetical protein BKA70DRAFT_215794 [Coprinopsis sp. MPI-PUGE-AT-0042]
MLRLDDSEALLMDIRSALRNEPSADAGDNYRPTLHQLWVNGLWFASLLITLFSAIVAVLARSWLVNHLPISNRKEAIDAYKRRILDDRAERWKLQKVITSIPLLVQLAFLLFAIGLGIQTYDDNRVLGIFVLAMVVGGTLLYLVVTALPLVLPTDSCPFSTPLSDILLDLQALLISLPRPKGRARSRAIPKSFSNTLAKILYEGMINSGKPELADEAVLELSRRPPSPKHLDYFATHNTPVVCVQRIRDCTLKRFKDPSQRDEIIGAHLQVLLRLVATWEGSGHKKPTDDPFKKLIQKTISPTGILGRWDFLPQTLRALAYAVRVPMYLTCGRDFENSASPGMEWDSAIHYIQPAYRLSIVTSACRGIVQGKQNIQRVSALSLVHLIAQGYISVRQNRHTKWSLSRDEEKVLHLCVEYLERLFNNIAPMWGDGPNSFLSIQDGPQDLAILAGEDKPYNVQFVPKASTFSSPEFPPANLLAALTAMDLEVRSQGRTLLVALARQGHVKESQMENLLSALFETMFDLSCKPNTVRQCIRTTVAICETAHRKAAIEALSERIHRALETNDALENGKLHRGLAVVEQIAEWATGPESQGIEEALWIVAPRLIEIDLTARFQPSFERWRWLKRLFDSSNEENLLRFQNRLQEPLLLELAKVFKFEPGAPEEGDTSDISLTLDQHEVLDPLATLVIL